jgi:hypothetical protein
MNKLKFSGLIIGTIGLAILFFNLFLAWVSVIPFESQYAQWEVNIFIVSAIFWSGSFILGVTAMISYMKKKGVYLMVLSTLIGAIGWAPLYWRSQILETEYGMVPEITPNSSYFIYHGTYNVGLYDTSCPSNKTTRLKDH